MRQEEITACVKVISILASDDARDQFSKTFNSFLQVSQSSLRSKASHLLAGVAAKTSSADLAALAVSVKLDVFI